LENPLRRSKFFNRLPNPQKWLSIHVNITIMKTIKRALIFTRVSTGRQEQQRQIKQLTEACKKLNLKPVIALKETVSGATRTKKPNTHQSIRDG